MAGDAQTRITQGIDMDENTFWIAFWSRAFAAVVAVVAIIAIYNVVTFDRNPPIKVVTTTTVERAATP